MKEAYNINYYTLNLIPKYRQEYITLRLKWLMELLNLNNTDWPLDCIMLLNSLKALQLFSFDYIFTELPDKCDAMTEYIKEYDLYFIYINKNKVNYPYRCSHDRRLNFTLAHELAHIAMGHLLIPRDAKSKAEQELEEIEADEFAGRLLMPEKLLFSCNYYSLSSAAEYFMVSKTALWKRLNNMKQLSLLRSRSIKTCQRCGNTNFPLFTEYCGICGEPIASGLTGIHRVLYASSIPTTRYKSVVECPLCKSTHFYGDKCTRCGTFIFNFCSDYIADCEETCSHASLSRSRFCEMCGKPTYFYKRGLLSFWENEQSAQQNYV